MRVPALAGFSCKQFELAARTEGLYHLVELVGLTCYRLVSRRTPRGLALAKAIANALLG